MNEVEVKILEIDRKEVEDKLIMMGAKKIFEGELCAIVFDTKDDYFKNNKMLLRLRKEGEKTFITLKKKVKTGKVKSAKEIETEVKEFETMKEILKQIGLEYKEPVKKSRISYKLGNIKFEFDKYHDKWEHIPEFLEIESDSEEKVLNAAKKLGFAEKDIKPLSGWGVFKHYSNKD